MCNRIQGIKAIYLRSTCPAFVDKYNQLNEDVGAAQLGISIYILFSSFVCLWFYVPHKKCLIITTTGEGLQILSNTRHSWLLISEGFSPCDIISGVVHSFIMVISKEHDTHICCRTLGSGAVITCFNDFGLSRPGFEPRPTAC